MDQPGNAFSLGDWTVLLLYLAGMVVIGWFSSRRQTDHDSYFLGNRSMPAWAVGMSVLATSLSAATFISVPQLAFSGDLSYLVLNIGGVLGAFLVAKFFLPPLYHAGTTTIYGFLGLRYGKIARASAALLFLAGRLLASGARLFIAAIAFSLILYGDIASRHLIAAIILFGGLGTFYTILGGIRAVIWTDAVQILVVVFAALLSIVLLLRAIPLSTPEILAALRDSNGRDKLLIFDFRFHWSLPFTVWTGIIASTFVSTAAYSVDHDMVQRMLTTKTARGGGNSLIASILIGIPVVGLFLLIGMLLSIYYGRPDLMAGAAPLDVIEETKSVYPRFLLHHLPSGLKGLAMAGLFAAAMSSLDSAVNAMASSAVTDLYQPWKDRSRDSKSPPLSGPDDFFPPRRREKSPADLIISRRTVALMGFLLTGFAILAVFLQSLGNDHLINFALGVMAFANAPLLGVFSAALFTKRGSAASVLLALAGGCLITLLLQPYMVARWLDMKPVAWPWWWVIVSPLSFLICISAGPKKTHEEDI